MVGFPRSWRGLAHAQAARPARSGLVYHPGWRGSGQQPISRVPVQRYVTTASGVPLNGGQAQGPVNGAGACTLSVGPAGLGTVWYIAQVTISTTTGALDSSTAQIYLGPAVSPTTLVASIFSGNGTAALAIPPMAPGQTLICKWTGGHPGDIAAFNAIGTQDALTTQ